VNVLVIIFVITQRRNLSQFQFFLSGYKWSKQGSLCSESDGCSFTSATHQQEVMSQRPLVEQQTLYTGHNVS